MNERDEAAPRLVRPRAVLVVALLAVVVALLPLPGLEPRAHRTLVVLVAAAGWWMSEAVPVAWTALAIPVLAVLLGIAAPKAAFAGFGDPILFLFFGTFLLTTAAFDHGLQTRLAQAVLHSESIRRHPGRLAWAVALLGCLISMWVNNTATTALLLPLALTGRGRLSDRRLVCVLLLAAYGPSLGGIATPVGTAPNLIGLRLLESQTGVRVSFAHWCAVFAPLALLFTIVSAGAFELRARWESRHTGERAPDLAPALTPDSAPDLAPATAPALEADGPPSAHAPSARRPWSRAERTLVPIYVAVVFLWILPGILLATPWQRFGWVQAWSERFPESCVPLAGGLALFLLPSGRGRTRILDASVLGRIDWSTLLLFGGGLSLGGMMFETGLARALGDALFAHLPVQGTLGIVFASALLGVLVSEVTSNTASASLVVPVVLALAQAGGLDPVKPALAATIACSFGFMLPVSTPPNALVYATGRIRVADMVRAGIGLDLMGVLVVTLWVTFLS